jgi:hypothetical protein
MFWWFVGQVLCLHHRTGGCGCTLFGTRHPLGKVMKCRLLFGCIRSCCHQYVNLPSGVSVAANQS